MQVYPGTAVEKLAFENGCLPGGFSWSIPISDKNIKELIVSDNVPVFMQPQFGLKEYRLCKIKSDQIDGRIPTFSEAPIFLIKKLFAMRSLNDFKHIIKELWKNLRWKLQ